MDRRLSGLGVLVDEYRTLAVEATTSGGVQDGDAGLDKVAAWLAGHGEWTPRAATELARLVEKYGAFVLRNAAALAIALDVEDGEEGL